MSKPLPPFLTPFEFIRVFTNALNLTKQSKRLDDKVHNLMADYRDIKESIEQFIKKPLDGYLDSERSAIIGAAFAYVLLEYLELIRTVDVDGITRTKNNQLIAEHFLPLAIVRCTEMIKDQMPGPDPIVLFGSNCSAISTVLNWAEDNLVGWNRFYSGLTGEDNKTKRDRINRWKSGSELPTLAYIKSLQGWSTGPWPELMDWNHLKAWLLIARAIDWARQSEAGTLLINEVRSILWGATPAKTYKQAVAEVQRSFMMKLRGNIPVIAKLQHALLRTASKTGMDAQELKSDLEGLRSKLKQVDPEATSTHWVDLHEARWHVFSGDLGTANECYKIAFEGCLYRSGDEQVSTLKEARSVASSLKRPDTVFLKKLRNVAVLLGVDAPTAGNKVSKTSFEAWEVNAWRKDFRALFPSDCLFDGVTIDIPEAHVGPLVLDEEKKAKLESRNPNQKTKIGGSAKKGIQKLTLAIHSKDYDAAQRLIKSGAKVNCLSDSNESPLLMALEMANKFDHPYEKQDERFFDLISKQQHDSKIINQVTTKKKQLPLILAVKSGNPRIVKKVLEMGADVNARGETDNQTALNICLKIISSVIQPEKHWETQMNMEMTAETFEAVRRYTNGALGSNIEDVKANLDKLKHDKIWQEALEVAYPMCQSRAESFAAEDLREIASILLKAGADPNAEHQTPLRGHTPLMLATELDEVSIVEEMLMYGGLPNKTYYDHKAKGHPDCWDIAYYHRAKKVRHLLNGIRHHFRKPELPLEDA